MSPYGTEAKKRFRRLTAQKQAQRPKRRWRGARYRVLQASQVGVLVQRCALKTDDLEMRAVC